MEINQNEGGFMNTNNSPFPVGQGSYGFLPSASSKRGETGQSPKYRSIERELNEGGNKSPDLLGNIPGQQPYFESSRNLQQDQLQFTGNADPSSAKKLGSNQRTNIELMNRFGTNKTSQQILPRYKVKKDENTVKDDNVSQLRDQIEQLVRERLTQELLNKKSAAKNMGSPAGGPFRPPNKNLNKTVGDINKNAKQLMNQTNITSLGGDLARLNFLNNNNMSPRSRNSGSVHNGNYDDVKSQKTVFTTKTKYTKKTKGAQGVLVPLGLAVKQAVKEQLTAETQKKMIQDVLGTEVLVDKIIIMLQNESIRTANDEDAEWPEDTTQNTQLRNGLSYSKMINEINHREPRNISSAGTVDQQDILSTSVGFHTTKKEWRHNEIDQIGISHNLYLKMLKYFTCMFLVFFLISIPSILIYQAGGAYKDHPVDIQKGLAQLSLGSYDSSELVSASAMDIKVDVRINSTTAIINKTNVTTNTTNITVSPIQFMPVQCPENYVIQGLEHFGLALQNYTVVGNGYLPSRSRLNVSVKTVDRCTYGQNPNLSLDASISQSFKNACIGLSKCQMPLNFSTMFDLQCNREINQRILNKSIYGAPRIYALALCQEQNLGVNSNWRINRNYASNLVVSIDLGIMLLFLIAVFRLQIYEDLSSQDIKEGSIGIEDFTVHIPDIPISVEDYNGNPELLAAMLATHLEDIVSNEVQVIKPLEDAQQNQAQVAQVNFGHNSYSIMKRLVKIIDLVKQIHEAKKKQKNDPKNSRQYERQVWSLYQEVTDCKDAYYDEKMNVKPQVLSAYVTFRSMEGKQRAIQAYQVSPFTRFIVEKVCCQKAVFSKKKLLQKEFLRAKESVAPEMVIWENFGQSKFTNIIAKLMTALICFLMVAVCWYIMTWVAYIEKNRVNYVKNDCDPKLIQFDKKRAYDDMILPQEFQEGIMNCFCKDLLLNQGYKGLQLLFDDGQQYCRQWYPIWYYDQYSTYILASLVCLINIFIFCVSKWLIDHCYNPNSSYEAKGVQMVIIFFWQYINSAIVFVLAYNSFVFTSQQRQQNNLLSLFQGPFDEFSVRWYLVVGSAIAFVLLMQIVLAHTTIFISLFTDFLKRCWDRRCTCNLRNTKKVVQSDYENLYTGPELLLPIRFAQIQSTIFLTMTYSSGIPFLYAIAAFSFFATYWIDKILILRYYKISTEQTQFLNKKMVQILPLAVLVHIGFGYLMFSCPFILTSEVIPAEGYASTNQYFAAFRISQTHMIIFTVGSLVALFLIIFKPLIFRFCSLIASCLDIMCLFCCKVPTNQNSQIFSDDLYKEIKFSQLFNELKKIRIERLKFKILKSQDRFTAQQAYKYVDDYVQIIERNESEIYKRLLELSELHIERICGIDPELMSEEQKINTVFEYFSQAVNKDNPLRGEFSIDQVMHGRMLSSIQSYDFMDNTKYQQLDQLLLVLKETFGLNEDISTFIQSSLPEANYLLAKDSVEIKKIVDLFKNKELPQNGYYDDESMQSNQQLNANDNIMLQEDFVNLRKNAGINLNFSKDI